MTRRPNIVFLIADDHRHDVLGVAGHPVIQTPNWDALARRGTRLTRHHCQGGLCGAICAPSRAEILTGRELFRATRGVDGSNYLEVSESNPEAVTLPESLRQQGYRTHGIGKWHNGTESYARSFDSGAKIFFGGMSDHDAVPVHDFDPSGAYPAEAGYTADGFSTDVFTDAVLDFLAEDHDQPFFLWTAFTAPHDPRTPPADWAARYQGPDMELPANFQTDPPPLAQHDIRDEQLAATPRDPDEIKQHIADYYGMISDLDEAIGVIIAKLADTGLLENTIVVYTADHGLAVGHHGLLGKQSMYEHSLRVPLIVAGPGIEAGKEISDLTIHADLFATLATWAQAEVPATVEGHNLAGVITAGETGPREVVHAAYLRRERMASDGHHKLIEYYEPERATLLFDLVSDPHETTDLSGQPEMAPVVDRLRESLAQWQQAAGDPIAQ